MRILSGMLVLSGLVGPSAALAADFDAGMRAANVGNFAAAARECRHDHRGTDRRGPRAGGEMAAEAGTPLGKENEMRGAAGCRGLEP